MRYINFTIDGGNQDILVRMEEQADGSVRITLTVDGKPADIRGLFFDVNDSALLANLLVSGANVTSYKVMDEGVMDLGHGVNMHGGGRDPFDVGVEFGSPGNGKDVVSDTSIVLTSLTGDLTLDDLALIDFGVRLTGGGAPPKLVMTSPAAPDAIDDNLNATEDTTSIYTVLANDTDADGTGDFMITSVSDPEHGTATISADGKTVIYTPDLNYSGSDSFTYEMIDGHGGGDTASASIAVEAVADAPTLQVDTAAGANVNEILITVTAAVTDTDGSEFLDRFEFSGLPAGAQIVGESDLVYDPADDSGQSLMQTFTVQLAPNTDFNFDLGVEAIAKESSNGDEEGTLQNVSIMVDAASNEFSLAFAATDQSIWNSGSAYVLEDNRFIGFELDPAAQSTGGFIYGSADLYLKAGFQSHLTFDGGSIDADVPYDVTIDTTYNHTTDILLIESFADLLSNGVTFSTDGPSGSYVLDFIFNYAVSASLGIDFGVDEYDLFSFSSASNNTLNILNIQSEDLGLTFEFPYGLSITLAWPNVDTDSLVSSGTVFTSSGASNNFLELGVDVDQALADILLGGVNPFDLGFDITVAWGNAEMIDVDLSAGMNFLQDFSMALADLGGTLLFETGATMAWDFSDIMIANASSYDQDGDGSIEFELMLDQGALLTNNTDLGFNMGYNVDLLKASGGYDFLVDSGDWSVGPVWSTGQTFPLGAIDLYEASFSLDFASQSINFVGNQVALV